MPVFVLQVPQSSPSTHHPLRSGNGDPRYMRVPMDRSAPGVVGSGGQLVGVDRPMGMNDLTPRAAHMQQMQRPYGPQVHQKKPWALTEKELEVTANPGLGIVAFHHSKINNSPSLTYKSRV